MAWIDRVLISCSQRDACLAIMLCWVLWTHRNNVVWRNSRWSSGKILEIAGSMLQQWQGVRSVTNTFFSNSNNNITNAVSWEKPEFWWIKVNIDAVVFWDRSITRLGWVIRDSLGSFISAHGTIYQMQLHPHMAETMGVQEVLSWIKRSYLSKVVVEMDAQVVFNALHSSQFAFSPFAMLI